VLRLIIILWIFPYVNGEAIVDVNAEVALFQNPSGSVEKRAEAHERH